MNVDSPPVKESVKLKVGGVKISDFVNKDLQEFVGKFSQEYKPIGLIFMPCASEKKGEDKKSFSPILIIHESKSDLDKDIIYVECEDSEVLDRVVDFLLTRNKK